MTTEKSRIFIYSKQLDEQKSYWVENLSREREKSGLALDYLRPDTYLDEKDSIEITLPDDYTSKLDKMTDRSPFLLYTTLITVLKIWLHKHTGSSLITVGSPARKKAGQPASKPNALAIVDKVDEALSFRQLLMNVRQTLLEAYGKQDYPYERLVQDLGLSHIENQCPLFDISIALKEIHEQMPKVKNDISIIFEKTDGKINGKIEFNKSLYAKGSIEGFAKQYLHLLSEALHNSSSPASQLKLLPSAHLDNLLLQFNDTSRPFSSHLCIHHLFEAAADAHPDSIAISFNSASLSYSHLDHRSNQLARFLIQAGVAPEMPVAVLINRGPSLIIALLATLKSGGAYLPIDASYPPERVALLLNDSKARFVITERELEGKLESSAAEVIALDSCSEQIASHSTQRVDVGLSPQNLAYIIYTSGSTGRPKGVMVEHRGVCNLAQGQVKAFGVNANSRVLQFASTSFDASISEVFMAIVSGARLVMAEARQMQSAQGIEEVMRQEQVSVVTLPPAMLKRMDERQARGVESLISAGEACSREIARKWSEGRRMYNAYGPTEASVCATIEEVEASSREAKVAIGRPMQNVRVYVMKGEEVAEVGVKGELAIGGAGVARGYLGEAAKTAERFVPEEKAEGGARMYRSGDICVQREEGKVEYIGREDRQVKVRGVRVELGEVEKVMEGYEGVKESVVEVRGEEGEEVMVCYVVKEGWEAEEERKLREYMKRLLPSQMVPGRYVRIEEIPLTINGKVDRERLEEEEREWRKKEERVEEYRSETEEEVGRIWGELLKLERVGRGEDFFELGGHSLLAMQVISRVREVFRIDLQVQDLFENSNLADFAEHIDTICWASESLQPSMNLLKEDREVGEL
jgi:amino acid adenylation domain-containing protein